MRSPFGGDLREVCRRIRARNCAAFANVRRLSTASRRRAQSSIAMYCRLRKKRTLSERTVMERTGTRGRCGGVGRSTDGRRAFLCHRSGEFWGGLSRKAAGKVSGLGEGYFCASWSSRRASCDASIEIFLGSALPRAWCSHERSRWFRQLMATSSAGRRITPA